MSILNPETRLRMGLNEPASDIQCSVVTLAINMIFVLEIESSWRLILTIVTLITLSPHDTINSQSQVSSNLAKWTLF